MGGKRKGRRDNKRKFISSVSCVRRIAELNIYSPFACIHPFDSVLLRQSMRHLFYDDSFMTWSKHYVEIDCEIFLEEENFFHFPFASNDKLKWRKIVSRKFLLML